MNYENKPDKNNKKIKNVVFLNNNKNRLKKNIDLEKIVIIAYEIMENILYLEYDIDYLIIISYDIKNNSFDFQDIEVIDPNQFNLIDPHYEQIILDKGYYEPKNKKNKINLGESTNELLKEKEENIMESNVRRVKSGKIKNIESDENTKLKAKRKKKKNEDINTEDDNEENIDELYPNEKRHNISYNFTNKKKEKENNNNDIILLNQKSNSKNNIKDIKEENVIKQINIIQDKEKEHKEKKEIKEEKNDEAEEFEKNYKFYFFNENQIIINLSNYKQEPIKPSGLINPSIYCFMISILQALISIPELNYFFLSKIYLLSSLYNNRKDSKINFDQDISEDDYPVCTSYQKFIKVYLLSKKNCINIPRILFHICNKLLGGMHMHDSQEFFVCFLEAMQEELNPSHKNKKKNENKIEKIKKIEKEIKMEDKWNEYRIKNNSFIDSLFTGLMRSTVECKSCKHRSITYDPFIDLNVSISKYKNLEKCLKQFFENEKIDCEYKCDNCKQISKVSFIINNNYFILF